MLEEHLRVLPEDPYARSSAEAHRLLVDVDRPHLRIELCLADHAEVVERGQRIDVLDARVFGIRSRNATLRFAFIRQSAAPMAAAAPIQDSRVRTPRKIPSPGAARAPGQGSGSSASSLGILGARRQAMSALPRHRVPGGRQGLPQPWRNGRAPRHRTPSRNDSARGLCACSSAQPSARTRAGFAAIPQPAARPPRIEPAYAQRSTTACVASVSRRRPRSHRPSRRGAHSGRVSGSRCSSGPDRPMGVRPGRTTSMSYCWTMRSNSTSERLTPR